MYWCVYVCAQSFVSCTLGVRHVGYNVLAYGLATVVSTLLANHAQRRRVSRETLIGVAAVLQAGILVFLLVWIPDGNLFGVFVAVAALSGICDGFWITQCTCTLLSLVVVHAKRHQSEETEQRYDTKEEFNVDSKKAD